MGAENWCLKTFNLKVFPNYIQLPFATKWRGMGTYYKYTNSYDDDDGKMRI